MRSTRSRRSSRSRSRSTFSRRSSTLSSFSRSRYAHRVSGGIGRGLPVGQLHPISKVLLILLLVSFFFNFVMTIVAPFTLFDWGLWIFFLPFIFAVLFMIVTIITSFSSIQHGLRMNLPRLFEQSGRMLMPLTIKQPLANYFEWQEQEERYVLITLSKKATYDARLLQSLLEPLKQQNYRELWIVQDPARFTDSDRDYARFYNVLLLTMQQLDEKLSLYNSPVTQ